MIVLAVILLLVAAALVVLMITIGFTTTLTFDTVAGDVVTRPFWVFLLGAATLLIALMGLSLLHRGTRRSVERRREIKRLRKIEQGSHGSAGPVGSADQGREVRDTRGGGGHASADLPDRTVVRERPTDPRTTPGGTLRASMGPDDPQAGSSRRPS